VNENNFNAKDCPQSYKVTTNVTNKVSIYIICFCVTGNRFISIIFSFDKQIAKEQLCENSKNFNVNVIQGDLNPNASPATSNLLQILTVLTTSSADELDKNKSNSNNSKRSFGNTSDNSGLLDKSNLNSSRVAAHPHQVHVFHPDDEKFRLFFGKTIVTSPVSILANDSVGNNEGSSGSRINSSSETLSLLEMNVIQRESDLLVMKKNVPLVRRKSSGKNSRNPLKTLAARMDFRNQWYTDETQ
jgi:hypothetical protein